MKSSNKQSNGGDAEAINCEASTAFAAVATSLKPECVSTFSKRHKAIGSSSTARAFTRNRFLSQVERLASAVVDLPIDNSSVFLSLAELNLIVLIDGKLASFRHFGGEILSVTQALASSIQHKHQISLRSLLRKGTSPAVTCARWRFFWCCHNNAKISRQIRKGYRSSRMSKNALSGSKN